MCSLRVTLLLVCLSFWEVSSLRAKRQLSPAVGLEDRLSPLLMGYAAESSAFKRSAPMQLKRHISPSFDVEEDVGSMRTLMDIGKRHVSVADDVGRHFEMYNRLFDAGKKRAVISPSHDLEASAAIRSFLEAAGRK